MQVAYIVLIVAGLAALMLGPLVYTIWKRWRYDLYIPSDGYLTHKEARDKGYIIDSESDSD